MCGWICIPGLANSTAHSVMLRWLPQLSIFKPSKLSDSVRLASSTSIEVRDNTARACSQRVFSESASTTI